MICGTSDIRNENYRKKFRSDYLIIEQFVHRSRPIVFDVGAHKGETIHELLKYFRSPIIHAFEPNPDVFKTLRRQFAKRRNIHLNNCGVGRGGRGRATLFQNKLTHTSGFLRVNEGSADHVMLQRTTTHERERFMHQFNNPVEVEMTTVDRYCATRHIPYIDILKIDVQGYEVECLRGSTAMLSTTRVIKCELTLFDYYERSTSFFDIERLLRRYGFRLYAISHCSQNPSNGRTDWVETIYVRRKSPADA